MASDPHRLLLVHSEHEMLASPAEPEADPEAFAYGSFCWARAGDAAARPHAKASASVHHLDRFSWMRSGREDWGPATVIRLPTMVGRSLCQAPRGEVKGRVASGHCRSGADYATMPSTTSYFTAASLRFLRALARNNRREWFEAHRRDYETAILFPMRDFVEEMDVRLAGLAPEMSATRSARSSGSTATSGSPRTNRHTRRTPPAGSTP